MGHPCSAPSEGLVARARARLRDLPVAPRPLGRRWLLWQARRPYVRAWGTEPLVILPGVLDPVATKVGAWLAAVAAEAAAPGERWLDMGTGSGVVGLALAARGARVTSVDIDPAAVRNARLNAALLGRPLEVLEGDLFAPVAGRRFQRVVYNVPFWPGEPAGRPFGRAMFAGRDFEAIRRFIDSFPAHADVAWIVLSEHGGDPAGARAALGPARLLRREWVRGEWLALYELGATAPSRDHAER